MVVVVDEPFEILALEGLREMLKSPTFTVTVAECVI